MSSHPKRARLGPYALAAAGAALAVGLALLAAGGWSQPADADDGELGTKVVTNFAGTGDDGFSGDGGPATEAELNSPASVAVDSDGNTYIADESNNRVRRVDPSGTITTVAGTGSGGFGGDGGPATEAQLNSPRGVAVDSGGNVYIADQSNHRIRKVDTDGVITTVAGTGSGGFSGDGGQATDAQINGPFDVASTPAGVLYIADSFNHRIRKVDTDGVITTVAGTGGGGFGGDGGQATDAQLNLPLGVGVSTDEGFYIADTLNHRLREVDASGNITTVAGTGNNGFSGDNGPATEADLNFPYDVAEDALGNLYIADATNARIRKIDTGGVITTEAGGGESRETFDVGVLPTEAHLGFPVGVAVDEDLGVLTPSFSFDRVLQVTHVPDLVAVSSLTGSSNPATVGEELTYTAEVTNPGLASDARGVTVTLPLPAEVEFASADPTQGSCTEQDNTLVCEVGALAEGETAPVSVTVTPTEPAIIRDVEVSITADGDDPYPHNNSAAVTTVVADAGCGQVLTEDTTLEEDIGPCPGNGLVVGADGITVDLNGHELIGWRGYEGFAMPYRQGPERPDEPGLESINTGREAGVLVADRHDATVKGPGTVSRFAAGVVVAQGASGNTVEGLTVTDNAGLKPRAQSPLSDGILVFNAPGNTIADNTLRHNGWYNGLGVWGADSDDNEIVGNTVTDSPALSGTDFARGIIVNGADEAQGTITGTRIANNTVRNNGAHGISNVNNFDAKIVNNLVENNGLSSNGDARGIGVSTGRELSEADANVTVAGNTVRNNGLDGININARGNKIINNTSLDNGQTGDWFDLHDLTSDTCEYNTWNNNEWGNAGYSPECTSTRGLGPGRNPGAGADPDRPEEAEMPSRPAPSFGDIGQ